QLPTFDTCVEKTPAALSARASRSSRSCAPRQKARACVERLLRAAETISVDVVGLAEAAEALDLAPQGIEPCRDLRQRSSLLIGADERANRTGLHLQKQLLGPAD